MFKTKIWIQTQNKDISEKIWPKSCDSLSKKNMIYSMMAMENNSSKTRHFSHVSNNNRRLVNKSKIK